MPRPIALLAFCASFCVLGCGSPRPDLPVPQKSTPAAEPSVRAEFYGEKRALPTLTAAEETLFHRAVDVAGRPLCRLDAALVDGARLHMADLLSGAVGNGVDAMDYLRFALHHAGAPDYVVTPYRILPGPEGLIAFDAFIAESGGDWTHCGVGAPENVKDGSGLWIGVRRAAVVTPVPVKVARGTRLPITLQRAGANLSGVEAYLEFPDGHVENIHTVSLAGGRYSMHLEFPDPGQYALEILLDTGNGLEAAMLLPVHVDMEVPRSPLLLPVPEESSEDPVASLLELVNRVRARSGAKPLKRDHRLDAVAQEHCRDMARNNTFGHYSAQTGTLLDRLSQRSLQPALMAENIARSGSLFRAHANLMRSPSHKIRLLKPEFTHMGAGVLQVGSDVLITEIFVRWRAQD